MNRPNDILDRINAIVAGLPVLTAKDIPDSEDSCPICLTSFSSIFLLQDPEGGVTKLMACNHIFCRKDLIQWIQSLHGNCPSCRNTFIDIRPTESDDESSDGGEYVPDEDFDEEDDGFMDTDGFSDPADIFVDDIQSDILDDWGDGDQYVDGDMDDGVEEPEYEAEWGSTDGPDDSEIARLENEPGDSEIARLEDEALNAAEDSWCADSDLVNQSSVHEFE